MKVVVMDLDGTLVDSFEDIAAAANHALVTLGRPPLPTGRIKEKVGHGLTNLIRSLLPEADDSTIERAARLVREYYSEHPVVYSKLYSGVSEMLDQLEDLGCIRAILSNKVDPLVQSIAQQLGLTEKTDEIWGHRDGYPLKPDPASLTAILEKHSATPEQCVVVGDYFPDQQLARNAGTRFCAVTWGMTPEDGWDLNPDDWLIEKPEDLPRLIREERIRIASLKEGSA